jgi:hypothetical protein
LVVVDESAMTNTPDLASVHDIVQAAGAKLLLTRDHRQLAAVGAAGGMEMIARISPAYKLTEAGIAGAVSATSVTHDVSNDEAGRLLADARAWCGPPRPHHACRTSQ